MMEYLVPIAVVLALVLVNGIFVAAEFAIVGMKATRLQSAADSGSAAARYLLGIVKSSGGKDRFIAVCQLGITLASIGLGMYGEKTIASWLYGPLEHTFHISEGLAHTLGTIISLSLITYMHVVFGEMIPKALALTSPEQTGFSVTALVRTFEFIFRPLVWLLNQTALGLMRLLGIRDTGSGERLYTSSELEYLVEESAEGGLLDQESQHIIEGIFDFGETQVHEVMTPRTRIEALSVRAPLSEVEKVLEQGEHSRYPVMDRSLDQLLGYLHIKDIIRHTGNTLDIASLLRPLPVVPETMLLTDALRVMKKGHAHMAVVVDEFGGTAGMVTLSDLVGDILEAETPLQVEMDGTFELPGTTPIGELEDLLGMKLESNEATTVGGWVTGELGRPPRAGDQLQLKTHLLEVLEVSGVRITRLRITPAQGQAPVSPS